MKVIGQSPERWDAVSKVTGKADYTRDLPVKTMLYGKVCRSTIAHGLVTRIDISEALKVPGVVKVLTPDDVSQAKFPTAGHPFSLDPGHKDVADRNILTKRVRLYGDDIAAVIAETELAATEAVSKIKVEYEEYPFYLTPEEALAPGAIEIQEGTKNIIASTLANYGDVEQEFKDSDYVVEDTYTTQTVQHCHMENQVAYAYKDSDGRYTCVSSTQIPHICRRILGQAFEMPWSNFRVIKPFIGGGFGNKQDVTIEPLVVAMSMAVGGKPVMLDLEREETLAFTRVRHAISYEIKVGVSKDGHLKGVKIHAVSNNGAYASHGHAIVAKGAGTLTSLYKIPSLHYKSETVHTNTAAAGAMRGYGVPQVIFAFDSHMEKVAKLLGMDSDEIRIKNINKADQLNPITGMYSHSNGLKECIEKGKKRFNWDEKMAASKSFKAQDKKRGVGLAAFGYSTGVYPISLEMSGCRLILNQDGRIKMSVGATEIGQGSDTAFKQMVAEVVGIPYEWVIADSATDTDVSPFDTGSYASRQTYVSGMAVKKAAQEMRAKIEASFHKFTDINLEMIDLVDGNFVYKHNGEVIESLGDLALKTYYDIEKGECIRVDVSNNCHNTNYPFGVTFAEVEVDVKTGEVELLSILNVHDSGTIINPLLAEGQVHGGMLMGIGYGLAEELRYDGKTGKPLNNNLLDYKMPTFMDTCDLDCDFVEPYDPTGPFGNKALGEPPLCSPAAGIRNAVLAATGVEINQIPLTAQKVFEALKKD